MQKQIFFNLGVRLGYVVNATIYPRKRDSVFIVQEAVWPQGVCGQEQKSSSPPELIPRTVQAVRSRYTD